MPLPTSAVAAEFKYSHQTFGILNLQVTDDAQKTLDETGTCTANCNYYNQSPQQPLLLTQWYGTYGNFMPLIQYVPYDGMNHSHQLVFGIGYTSDSFNATLDQVRDTRKELINGADNVDILVSTTLDMTAQAGMYRPFFKYTQFDRRQDQSDHTGNLATDAFDDNGSIALMGVRFLHWGEGFKPFAGARLLQADILEDASDTSGKTRSSRGTDFLLGASGTI